MFADAVHPDDGPALQQALQRTLDRGEPFDVTVRVRTPQGERHTRQRGRVSARGGDGRPLRLVGTIEDVTERVEAERRKVELERTHAEARRLAELNEFKSRFLGMVAHDLNNVLTPMRINLRLVADEASKAGTDVPHLANLRSGVERLASFLADLLDASRLQSGQLALNRARFDLAGRLHALVDSLRAQAASQGIRLAIDSPVFLSVYGDAHRLDQVMANLLSNALKFTPRDGTVTVHMAVDGPDVHLTVRDTGAGVAKEDQAKLFQPFSRLGQAGQGKHTGTGLGLFISRGIVEQHGGRIGCESEGAGKGAVFRMQLPLKPGT
jgi:signal transduction histidine kinase